MARLSALLSKREGVAYHIQLYLALSKARLSFFVACSSWLGYGFAEPAQMFTMSALGVWIGGFFISSGASSFNQLLEKETDKQMKRTCRRPLASDKLHPQSALYWSISITCLGVCVLYMINNSLVALLSLLSLLLYAGVYTPLKRFGPVAVFVGAVPGACASAARLGSRNRLRKL